MSPQRIRAGLVVLNIIFAAACYDEPTSIIVEPLRIVGASPTGGGLCVDVNVTVLTSFSDDLDPATLTAETYFLSDADGAVATTLDYDSATYTASLAPSAPLQFDRLYTVTVGREVRSVNDGRLPTGFEYSFMTIARHGCNAEGFECLLPSDCDAGQICSNIGTCIDECVTDRDCFRGDCVAGDCVPWATPDGGDVDGGDVDGGDGGGGDPVPGGDDTGDGGGGDPGPGGDGD